MSTTLNIEQIRASKTFEFAAEGNERQKKPKSKFNYSAQVKSLPALLRTNGLLNAMGYYYHKGKGFKEENEYAMIFRQIVEWFRDYEPTGLLKSKFKISFEDKPGMAKEFMEVILALSEDEYRYVYNETKALTKWLVRFVIDEQENNKKNGTGKQ